MMYRETIMPYKIMRSHGNLLITRRVAVPLTRAISVPFKVSCPLWLGRRRAVARDPVVLQESGCGLADDPLADTDGRAVATVDCVVHRPRVHSE